MTVGHEQGRLEFITICLLSRSFSSIFKTLALSERIGTVHHTLSRL